MTTHDILYNNTLKMRHKDRFVIILKTPYMSFTLGEVRFHAWIEKELDTTQYNYIKMCLPYEPVGIEEINYIDFKLYKVYIDNVPLQDEIYEMENDEYERRLNSGKKQNTKEVQEV